MIQLQGMKKELLVLGVVLIVTIVAAFTFFTRNATAPTHEKSLTDSNIKNMSLTLTSLVFNNNESIPSTYTCDGENTIPPLEITGVPEEADSLVLVMDDPDIPEEVKEARGIEKFNHWVSYNIATSVNKVEAGIEPGEMGLNTAGDAKYTGPCPPPQYEPSEHRYIFRLYAIKGQLNFADTPTLDEVELAAQAVVVDQTRLIGRYKRQQ